MDGNYWGIPRTSVFVDINDKTTEWSLLQVPCLDKSYNWPLLNRLILRFWPLGLRHGSDWLVYLLWHQYILITFVDTLTNSLHETRPTELAVLSPFKSDRSHFFCTHQKFDTKWEGSFLRWSIFFNHVGWQSLTWGRTGGSAWTPTPGFQPSYSCPILSSLPPTPFFFLIFFFGYPRPKLRFFAKAPSPYILPLPPPIFRQKLPPYPRHTNTPPPPPPARIVA